MTPDNNRPIRSNDLPNDLPKMKTNENQNGSTKLSSNEAKKEPALAIKDEPSKIKHIDTKKPKKKLWWFLIIVVLTLGIVALFLYRLNQKETEMFNACATIDDYRQYVSTYPQGKHFSEARLFIDNYVKDSIAEAERLRKEEEERMKWECYNVKMDNGRKLFDDGLFDQAKESFLDARCCDYRHDSEIDLWMAKCDTAKLEAFVCGEHLLSLQWISWDYFGRVKIEKESGGRYRCVGEQKSKYDADYLRLDGYITIISEKHLKFEGTIKSRVSFLNDGKEYCRKGTFDFKASGSRQYWREQKMNGPDVCDYVDIYFQKCE